MEYRNLHTWNITAREAIALQQKLRRQLIECPLPNHIRTVAGADISYERFSDVAYAAFVVIDLSTMKTIDTGHAVATMTFPYVPGLLTFREAPPLLAAWSQLKTKPDVVFFDGQGIAHPRRMGIAAHMGLFINRPSIGCGKSKLCGHYENLPIEVGSTAPLIDHGEQVGVALRTKARTNPVFISIGHRAELGAAVDLTMRTVAGYRIPEPTRRAHILVNELRRQGRTSLVA